MKMLDPTVTLAAAAADVVVDLGDPACEWKMVYESGRMGRSFPRLLIF